MAVFHPPLAQCEMAFVAMAAVAFITWVLKQIAAANQPQRPRAGGPRPVRPRNERVQQEIDQFIQDATGRRPPARKDVLSADEIEVVEPAQARRPAPRRPAPASRKGAVRPGQEGSAARRTPPPQAARGPGALASRTAEPPPVPPADRVTAHVNRDLPHAVDQAVAAHLGSFTGQLTGTPEQTGTVARVVESPAALMLAELQTPAGVQKAFVMQEVLQRPLALRRK